MQCETLRSNVLLSKTKYSVLVTKLSVIIARKMTGNMTFVMDLGSLPVVFTQVIMALPANQ